MSSGRLLRLLLLFAFACVLLAASWFVAREMKTSRLQAQYFSSIAREATFHVAPGPSNAVRFPAASGPYDLRLGYARIPDFTQRLAARGFAVTAQARDSARMLEIADRGLFLPYAEKDQAGLELFDARGTAIFSARDPLHVYADFAAVPPVIANALTFIEDRRLLDASQPLRNPAVDWGRFSLAAAEQGVHWFVPRHGSPGGSTLATQIEKFRHSPGGRTVGAREKLRQMVSGSLAAYQGGEHTLPARKAILVHYLNTEPLAAQAGGGEVQGLGDGLAAWYGRDFADVNRVLFDIGRLAHPVGGVRRDATPAEQALAFKQALSLLIAQRAPSYYLVQDNAALDTLTDSYLRLLASAGIIEPELRDAALAQPLHVRHAGGPASASSFVKLKAASLLRARLLDTLGLANAYDLDRLDLSARTTLDSTVQDAVSARLQRVQTMQGAQEAGLYGYEMLRPGEDPSRIAWSFTLYEHRDGGNLLRIQTDSVNEPFDLNSGARLNLGSTAKLRTIVLYLQIVAQLHERYAALSPEELAKVHPDPLDALTRWAVGYLAGTSDHALPAMLSAAIERQYSANPGEVFFTGGGEQTFSNFEASDNGRTLTLHEAFQRSVNLVFVRLMRDIVRYEMVRQAGPSERWLADPQVRQKYLTRFADRESLVFLHRFRVKYEGLAADAMLQRLLQGVPKSPVALAAALRSVAPDAPLDWFERALDGALKGAGRAPASAEKAAQLYAKYGPGQFDLDDRAYLAHAHPIELWLVGYARSHPDASAAELVAASRDARIASYAWLLKPHLHATQDRRIREQIEQDAYGPIVQAWRAVGYPFESITPSYGCSIGAAGDRPSALATLMGILANHGRSLRADELTQLAFASGTPFETDFARVPDAGRQVVPPEVAEVARGLLHDVVAAGTGRRLAAGLRLGHGEPLPVYGKTGTGDQRFNVYARGGRLVESRKVNRSATFVFMLGDRFWGTLTAYTHAPYAARYAYTSAMAVQLLGSLGPVLAPTLERN